MTQAKKNLDSKEFVLKSLKGMADILPDKIHLWHFFEDTVSKLMAQYGYDEIRTPILERSALFIRSIGEASDIVEKEMFTFQDKDKASTFVSMRPEATASTVRLALEHGLLRNNQQQRLWYLGPMFRRENPQRGRFRQFYQFGVESFGFSGSGAELEHILLIHNLWKKLGIYNEITLELSSLGNKDSREKYTIALKSYFEKNKDQLDDDSIRRLDKNPLRILDSKTKSMQELIVNAPNILEYLDEESKKNLEELESSLQEMGVNYTINPKIVRGLDYYNGTVYEWTTKNLGSQGTVCAGGRYDSLSSLLGGTEAYAVGFALGIERVLMLMEELGHTVEKRLDCYLIAVGSVAEKKAVAISEKIRSVLPNISLMANISGGSFKSQFKRADKSNARFALILGDQEIENNQIGVKFLREERDQLNVAMEDVAEILGGLCGSISN